ncbi:hypothetical protein [Mesonia aquimarina]|uniref:hypothetical protein n=1 Tax=Mesonia aquimarina TaxID=1504967 RepID=UPI000EF63254|nr:hypothetical protein [Mesonia aquimarina]
MTSCSGFFSPTLENTKKITIKLKGAGTTSSENNNDVLIFAEDLKVYTIEDGQKNIDIKILNNYQGEKVDIYLPKMWFNQVGNRIAQVSVNDSILYTELK